MARGGATYTFKAKDVLSGKTNTFTYQSTVNLEQAEIQTNNATFLYKGGSTYTFMENDTGEMYELEEDMIDDITLYLKEGLDCYLMKHEGNIINILLPQTISYVITQTVPGLKGDRSSAGKKPATKPMDMHKARANITKLGDIKIVNAKPLANNLVSK